MVSAIMSQKSPLHKSEKSSSHSILQPSPTPDPGSHVSLLDLLDLAEFQFSLL